MSLVSIKMIAVNVIKSSLVSMELYTFVQTNRLNTNMGLISFDSINIICAKVHHARLNINFLKVDKLYKARQTLPASQRASQPASRPASQPACQAASQPTKWPASQPSQPAKGPASQQASQPPRQPARWSASQPGGQELIQAGKQALTEF